MVGPHSLDDDDPRLKSVESACMYNDTAMPVADPHPVAVGDTEPANVAGWIRAVGLPSRAMLEGVLLKLVFRNEREGARRGGTAAPDRHRR